MAITRMTLEKIKARPSKRDRARLKATTENGIRRQMLADGEDPDAELHEEDVISPWYIRRRLSMSQQRFADTLGIPIATLRNREQNRVMMEPATIALMRILAHEPRLRSVRYDVTRPEEADAGPGARVSNCRTTFGQFLGYADVILMTRAESRLNTFALTGGPCD